MVILRIIIWKSICRKEGHDDKGKILNRTLEQLAYAGTGNSRTDLYCRHFLQFGLVDKGRLDRACGYRGALLTDYRRSYRHAVRVASEKLSE
jgi:hypothetical protein